MSHPSRYAPASGAPGTTGEPREDEPDHDDRTASVPPTELFELLDDQYARTILEATREEALRARELIDRCEASKPTVYRRLNRLEDAGLVASRQAYDPDGHHCQVFRATFEAAVVDVGPDGIDAELSVASPT
jgi:predicted transcriptional regulator